MPSMRLLLLLEKLKIKNVLLSMQLLKLPLSKLRDSGTHGRSKNKLVSMQTEKLLKLLALVLRKNRLISLLNSRKRRRQLTSYGKRVRTNG